MPDFLSDMHDPYMRISQTESVGRPCTRTGKLHWPQTQQNPRRMKGNYEIERIYRITFRRSERVSATSPQHKIYVYKHTHIN